MKPHSLLEFLATSLDHPTRRPDQLSLGFLPLQRHPSGEPRMRRGTKPTPVPLSGFLNLSAVSWQTRASRPCFMPQPFLGFSLQSLPLTGIARPSRGRFCSLVVIHPRAGRRLLDLITAGFPDSHAFTQLPGSSRRLWASFSRAEARFPSAPGPNDGTRPFRQLHPLRSLDPPASPFASARVAPSQHAAPLLGFCLSRAFSFHASRPRPARTSRAHACAFIRGLGARTGGFDTPPPG
jgi:hypothetical protein